MANVNTIAASIAHPVYCLSIFFKFYESLTLTSNENWFDKSMAHWLLMTLISTSSQHSHFVHINIKLSLTQWFKKKIPNIKEHIEVWMKCIFFQCQIIKSFKGGSNAHTHTCMWNQWANVLVRLSMKII